MEFLYLLEKIRIPGLNELMLGITKLGEETAFLVAALIVFWCVDKYKGYYVLGVGLFGTLASQFMKLLCRIPAPGCGMRISPSWKRPGRKPAAIPSPAAIPNPR